MEQITCFKCLGPLLNGESRYGLHVDCFTAWFKVQESEKFVSIIQHAINSTAKGVPQESQFNSSFFEGAFKKYSTDLGPVSYILKMKQDGHPELPEVEYVCNQLGVLLGLPLAEHFMINFMGENTFVTKNFIKKGGTPSNLNHIYKYLKEEEFYDCETIINIIKAQTKLPKHVQTFIQVIIFDALILNHDRHGKNLGFVVTASNTHLAPIYDNVSYLGLYTGEWLKADLEQPGKVGVKDNPSPSITEYVYEFRRLGYEDDVIELFDKIKIVKVEEIIDKSFCSIDMKEALKRTFNKRYKELENAISSRS